MSSDTEALREAHEFDQESQAIMPIRAGDYGRLIRRAETAEARVAELEPPKGNPGATHYEGCWQTRGHHLCAMARVRELEAERRSVAELYERINQLEAELAFYENAEAERTVQLSDVRAELAAWKDREPDAYTARALVDRYEADPAVDFWASHLRTETRSIPVYIGTPAPEGQT